MTHDDSVETKSLAYQRMMANWPMVDALDGGTRAMRNAGELFLPREPKEDPAKWAKRRDRSWLFGAFKNTINEFSGMPFTRPTLVRGSETLPETLQRADRDIDRRGRTLTQFGATALREAIKRGVSFILAEFPSGATSLMRGARERLGVRPYLSHISPMDLFGFEEETVQGGAVRVASFRVHDVKVVKDGDFGQEEVDVVRRYNLQYTDGKPIEFMDGMTFEERLSLRGLPGTVEWYEKGEEDDDYNLLDVGPYSFVGNPLTPIYTHRVGFWEGDPAALDLAEKNVEHWQVSSDQSNLLRVARVPILFRRGLSQEEIEAGFDIGPTVSVDSKSKDADMKYVEHSGLAIGAGRQNILDIEEQMEVLKLRPRMKQSGDPKATVAAIGEARGMSALETWALDTAQALRIAYGKMLQFELGPDAELSDEFQIEVEVNNLVIDEAASNRIKNLLEMRKLREIDRQTFLEEIRGIGGLSEESNVDTIIQRLEDEANAEAAAFFPAPQGN